MNHGVKFLFLTVTSLTKLWRKASYSVALCIALIIAQGHSANAQIEPFKLEFHFFSIAGLIGPDGKTGPLAEVVQEIGDRAGLKFVMINTPIGRVDRILAKNEPAASGMSLDGPSISSRGRRSYPVIFRREFAFVKKGSPIPKSMDDIKNMTLVSSPSSEVWPELQNRPGIQVLDAMSDASAAKLLARGRADVWMSDETSTLMSLEAENIADIIYDPESPIAEAPARFEYNDHVPQSIVNRINLVILEMVIDGTLKKKLPNNFSDSYEKYMMLPCTN